MTGWRGLPASVLFVGVVRWIVFKASHPSNGAIDLLRRDDPLFDQTMRNDRRDPAVKEVQDSMVHALQANAQLVYSIPKVIRLGPTEVMAQFAQPLQPKKALVLHLRRQFAEPLQKRA